MLLFSVAGAHADSVAMPLDAMPSDDSETLPPITRTGGLYSPPGNWLTQRLKNSNILITSSKSSDAELAVVVLPSTHEVVLTGIALRPDVYDFSLLFPDLKIDLPLARRDYPFRFNSSISDNTATIFAKSISASDLPAVIHDLTKQNNVEITFNGRQEDFSLIGSSSAIGTLAKAAEDQGTALPQPFNPFPKTAVPSLSNTAPEVQAVPRTDNNSLPDAYPETAQNTDYTPWVITGIIAGAIGTLAFGGMAIADAGKRERQRIAAAVAERQRLQDLYNQRINTGFDAIREHARTLGLKRWQLISYDDYGTPQYGKWYREIDYFLNTVIWTLPALQGINRQANPQLDENYRKAIIQAAAANQPNQNGDIPFSDDMDPYAYERACAQVLTNEGWNARATVGSGDQGADVTAERNGIRIVLQCKLYSNAVPNSAVQQVAAARLHYAAQYAAVVSNARYTASAQQLARTTNVTLLHHDQLAAWARSLNTKPNNVEPIRA
ncbi:restriction endonuclease [Novacetimonas maltaceti]|nr:restriction endonuclease [Novacetimonas maltaceti]